MPRITRRRFDRSTTKEMAKKARVSG